MVIYVLVKVVEFMNMTGLDLGTIHFWGCGRLDIYIYRTNIVTSYEQFYSEAIIFWCYQNVLFIDEIWGRMLQYTFCAKRETLQARYYFHGRASWWSDLSSIEYAKLYHLIKCKSEWQSNFHSSVAPQWFLTIACHEQ